MDTTSPSLISFVVFQLYIHHLPFLFSLSISLSFSRAHQQKRRKYFRYMLFLLPFFLEGLWAYMMTYYTPLDLMFWPLMIGQYQEQTNESKASKSILIDLALFSLHATIE